MQRAHTSNGYLRHSSNLPTLNEKLVVHIPISKTLMSIKSKSYTLLSVIFVIQNPPSP